MAHELSLSGFQPNIAVLGCGNLGGAILISMMRSQQAQKKQGTKTEETTFTPNRLIACVRSADKEVKLNERIVEAGLDSELEIFVDDTVNALEQATIIILAVDPADVESVLEAPGIPQALSTGLLVSVAAGWTTQQIENTLYGTPTTKKNAQDRCSVLRVLPNIAAQVEQSITAIEVSPDTNVPEIFMQATEAIFNQSGKTVRVPPSLMNATTAVAGSTPAFFSVICDALVDAAVATGVPREMARIMIAQSMLGSATLLQQGMKPADLRDQGTSPAGCTIGGLMVMEEGAVRGHMGKALREAVAIANTMGKQD